MPVEYALFLVGWLFIAVIFLALGIANLRKGQSWFDKLLGFSLMIFSILMIAEFWETVMLP